MLLTTILNQCYRFKGFIYGSARFVRHQDQQAIEVLGQAAQQGAERCALAVVFVVQAMIIYRSGASSSFRYGVSRSFWCMPGAGWLALIAAL